MIFLDGPKISIFTYRYSRPGDNLNPAILNASFSEYFCIRRIFSVFHPPSPKLVILIDMLNGSKQLLVKIASLL
jgi:hypothetical protein